ncbi:TPA: bifunctional ornithine acetyltransferase/N-acetylglutamate synthase [Methanosarcina acetivorans]|jgi:glutamate N-acetyltransferase / amino-acid N-acetyltransferase|uniref:Glutamate N-acetyltransferase n=2 Tax=Methanosarcina acetivorans TaxID=2214 RepID=ARGJ_METAC|nr:bifunctional ornithine acetyltransferase/N-acetylglutamate synthase [Methanosarcina acetivorans]Q8TK55.1 RecName: Full=Arginine biosynthesis bifunctional protein ArgJ; Includes: RecName: Full=Glutamate N-acetyltransferase; AltName: Full=Ornithine acetyltransferase; Short=OATase; AltName: Full=Ornithine transacetylase; Includes: RecName: Full=Amino-acid acetyltransferase; AltName: Full=N-acetylglutamate synthase; Short=AGSase; Contains: RecName: Full=Arginine biosynthesis bifunctional protein Ar
MKKIEGGICAVKGVTANGIKLGKMGITVIRAEGPAAGVFTKNKVTAAPVVLSKGVIETQHQLSAIIANSGNANAFTGDDGFLDAMEMASALSESLDLEPDTVAVASTGVIGRRLDVSWIREHLPEVLEGLGSSPECSLAAAKAIMTTDKALKEVAVELDCGVRIGAIAKGSGMIEPNMGTMLCFAYTDALVPADVLDAALRIAVDKTFNMVVVDGDTSTNDMVLFTSTCKSGIKPCMECLDEFEDALIYLFTDLAKKMARDGEGATKLIEARVTGAKTYEDARLAVKAIVRSPLVKSAIFGKDPNWGRVVAAAGYSGAELEQERLSLSFSAGGETVELVKSGEISRVSDLALLNKIMANEEIIITLDFGMGKESATAWGCDLTYDYVRINAEYTT